MYNREMPMDSMFPRRRTNRVRPVLEATANEKLFAGFATRDSRGLRRSASQYRRSDRICAA
jgi:hypothetical protein